MFHPTNKGHESSIITFDIMFLLGAIILTIVETIQFKMEGYIEYFDTDWWNYNDLLLIAVMYAISIMRLFDPLILIPTDHTLNIISNQSVHSYWFCEALILDIVLCMCIAVKILFYLRSYGSFSHIVELFIQM